MQSRSAFLIPFAWWWSGAAVVGAGVVVVLRWVDAAFGQAVSGTGGLLAAAGVGALTGLVAGMPLGAANAGLAQLGGRHWVRFISTALAVATAVWMLRAPIARTDSTAATVTMIVAVGLLAWLGARAIVRITLGPMELDAEQDEARVEFRPVEMSTSEPHGEDLQTFVRTSLRTHGHGNALFTLTATRGNATSTHVLVDAGGTGHALDLTSGDVRLAESAESLSGFVLTEDRSLAIAPPGLSAAAVISEGISLIQRVTETDAVRVRFEGFGH